MGHEILPKISVSGMKTCKFSSKSTNVYKKFQQKKLPLNLNGLTALDN
jgi:hypothetical protein